MGRSSQPTDLQVRPMRRIHEDYQMSNTNTGGQAFPSGLIDPSTPEDAVQPLHNGMTLRDYLAGQALASVNLGIGVTDDFYSRTAKHCYALADAMLKAREA
jgi:hypothetical protein